MTARPLLVLLVAPLALALPALAPPASACHAGAWEHGPTKRLPLVDHAGVEAGLYARERTEWQEAPESFGCEEMTWRDRCTNGYGPFVIVPEFFLVAPDRPECLVGPWDFGVYVNDIEVGTEALP